MKIGIQTKYIVDDKQPEKGFAMIADAGFSCADFSLNSYLPNTSIYRSELNHFFDQPVNGLKKFFERHKRGAKAAGIVINQMHMPSPIFVPGMKKEINDYLWNVVASKSMEICHFFECPYIVIHGFKVAHLQGSKYEEWEQTEKFIDFLAPMAKEMEITLCIENLFNQMIGGFAKGPVCDVRKAVERIDRINEKYQAQILGFCFDTGHANLAGIDFEDFISDLGQRLKVLHIHDNNKTGDFHQIPFTSVAGGEKEKTVDWDGVISGLKGISFDGVLNFETAPALNVFPEKMKENTLKFIAGIGEYFAGQLSRNNL